MQWNLKRGMGMAKKERGHHINICEIYNPEFHKKSLKFNYSYPDG